MKKIFYKVYYTTNTCKGEFVIKDNNFQEELETLEKALKVMEEDEKKVDNFNKKAGLNFKIKHNYKIYKYTKEEVKL